RTSDEFGVSFDTFNDKVNGFYFGLSPYNIQKEGLLAEGENLNISWDNKWYSAAKVFEDFWQVEMAIPFSTLRYKVSSGENQWRVNFRRIDMSHNEVSSWGPVPRNFASINLAFAKSLMWETPPPKPGVNISLIPYVSLGGNKEFPRDEELKPLNSQSDFVPGIGMDAKVAVTPSLNLDITLNPDFSQVEVDQQQTNLSRFELFFPEKRQFFIENSDLFSAFGFPNSRPFFSRRIGINFNPVSKKNELIPIYAGLRLSGKINNNWRIGALNMQTARKEYDEENILPAANYSVGIVQRKLFTRSYISAIVANKENFLKNGDEGITKVKSFNRMAGLEFNYYSKDNKLEAESYYHHSFSPNNPKDAGILGKYIGYHHPNIDLNLGFQRIGKNYNPEIGFLPRKGIYSIYRPVEFTYNPKKPSLSKYINRIGVGSDGEDVLDLKGKLLDSELSFYGFIANPAGAQLSIGYYRGVTRLISEFDPTNAGDNPDPDFSKDVVALPIGVYRYPSAWMEFNTARRNKLYMEFFGYSGKYFNGNSTSLNASTSVRVQPLGIFSLDMNYNSIQLPKPYNSARYWLVGPRAELALSRSLFWSTFYQYNSQANNANINSRLQWRYKAVSDMFLVYTDDYFAQEISRYRVRAWAPKNRALVLKITYWLNV
ncbi:MAG: DUF5916 domain-containing protein, partial [Leadbetterella sp.]